MWYNIQLALMISLPAFMLFKVLYIKFKSGKLILRIDSGKRIIAFGIFAAILWITLMICNFKNYAQFKDLPGEYKYYKSQILNDIFWIEAMAIYIFGAVRCSEIREKGICYFYNFYRWNKLKEWRWLDENNIQLRITTFFKLSHWFQLSVSERSKCSIDEILNKYIP